MSRLFVIFALVVLFWRCNVQNDMDTDHNRLKVTWKVEELSEGENQASFTIVNTTSKTLDKTNWELYFTQITGGQMEDFEPAGVRIRHVSGYFFSLQPTNQFKDLDPGDSISFKYNLLSPVLRYSFVPEGMYVVFEGEEPQKIEEPYIKYYEGGLPESIRGATASEIFEQNKALYILPTKDLQIIPTPNSQDYGRDTLILRELSIGFDKQMEREANQLGKVISKFFTGPIHLAGQGESNVQLAYNKKVKNKEGYSLSISARGIRIEANSNEGLFYGIQTLVSLLPTSKKSDTLKIRSQTIIDAPRFPYRGLHIDMARNFKSKESVLKVLDVMGYYKLNTLNLQLTDDEGWRIEIPSIPELTEIGAKRGHTLDESDRIFPAYGSGPFSEDDEKGGTGYYTREDFIEIVKYAKNLHIDVIPKFDVPGHNRAAIKAMQSRYARIMREGGNKELAEEYLLNDPADQSKYMSVQGYNDNVVCVCRESTYSFVEKVVDELLAMYHDAGVELSIVHIGGDEVPDGVWEESPICEELISKERIGGTKNELAAYFVGRVNEILVKRGLVTAGWEEIVMNEVDGKLVPNPEFLDKPIVPYAWHSTYANPLANAGYKIILCNADKLYFDMAYESDPYEPGLVWAGMTGAKEPFDLNPYELDGATEVLKKPENIVGIQAQLWGETVWNEERMEYSLFPKMIGLAERAWSSAPNWAKTKNSSQRNERWNNFANTIAQKELDRLKIISGGVVVRLPKPGLNFNNGQIEANSALPGLEIRYTTDGSEPTSNSDLYTIPVEAGGIFKAKTFHKENESATSTIEFK